MIDGRVRFSEIDHTRKITVPSIINYFQDCSTFQSEDIGVGLDVLSKKKKAWILTYWQIVIDHYPKMNDKIQVSTWASKFKGMLAERNFCMTDENGEKAAYAQSVWVYIRKNWMPMDSVNRWRWSMNPEKLHCRKTV